MTEKQQNLINNFLEEIKEKLPEWIKCEKEELQDILNEFEEHIWDKASELSETGVPTEVSVNDAISQMGSPGSIAREYKRRGTPKYYITEELWSLYTNVLAIVLALILAVNVAIYVINAVQGSLVGFPSDIYSVLGGLAIGFSIVTIIFIGLSMEGYLPEDFTSEKDAKKKDRALQKAKVLGLPVSPKTGKQLKPFIKSQEKISEGIFGIIFGLVLAIQPFPNLEAIFDPKLLVIVRIWGLIKIFKGSLKLSRGIIGNTQPQKHQMILGILMCLKIVSTMLLIVMILDPGIIPTVRFENDPQIIALPPGYYDIYRVIVVVIMTIALLSTIEEIYWVIKLGEYKIS